MTKNKEDKSFYKRTVKQQTLESQSHLLLDLKKSNDFIPVNSSMLTTNKVINRKWLFMKIS